MTTPPREWARAVQHALPERLAWWVQTCVGKTLLIAPRAPQRESEEAILTAWCWLRPGPTGVLEPCYPDDYLDDGGEVGERGPATCA